MLYACMLADSYKNKIFFSESKLHVYIIKDCIKFLWIHVKKKYQKIIYSEVIYMSKWKYYEGYTEDFYQKSIHFYVNVFKILTPPF